MRWCSCLEVVVRTPGNIEPGYESAGSCCSSSHFRIVWRPHRNERRLRQAAFDLANRSLHAPVPADLTTVRHEVANHLTGILSRIVPAGDLRSGHHPLRWTVRPGHARNRRRILPWPTCSARSRTVVELLRHVPNDVRTMPAETESIRTTAVHLQSQPWPSGPRQLWRTEIVISDSIPANSLR